MKHLTILLLITGITLTSNFANTANLNPEIVKCTKLENNTKRLKCFDNYVVKNSAVIDDNIQKMTNTPVVNIKSTATDIQAKEELVSSFGQAHRYSEKEREFDELKSTIKSATKDLHNDWRFELDNGQVWIEKGGDKRAKFSDGDSIIIVRGIMNSFQLKKVGTKRRVRVRRIL